MNAFFYKAYGAPSTYTYGKQPKPVISKPDHVLIKVHAASINPIDNVQAKGDMKMMVPEKLPATIGFDASGVVEEVGTAVTDFKVGDEVVTRLPQGDKGSLAEYAMTTSSYFVRKPANLSHVEAACIPLVGLTAYQVLDRIEGGREQIKGKTVFVSGALGGAGSMGVQIAKALGASKVISTVSTPKMERAKKEFQGVVDQLIDYKTQKPVEVMGKQSVDFIYDTVGDAIALMPLLKPKHNIVSIATLPDGAEIQRAMPSTPWWLRKGLDLASYWYTRAASSNGVNYSYLFMSPNGEHLKKIFEMAEKGQIKAVVGEVVQGYGEGAEGRLREAMETLKNGGAKTGGKIVIKMVE